MCLGLNLAYGPSFSFPNIPCTDTRILSKIKWHIKGASCAITVPVRMLTSTLNSRWHEACPFFFHSLLLLFSLLLHGRRRCYCCCAMSTFSSSLSTIHSDMLHLVYYCSLCYFADTKNFRNSVEARSNDQT